MRDALCRGDEISARFSGWNGATGSLSGGVVFIDKASVPCVLQGNPDVHLLDATGHDLPIELGKYSVQAALPVTLLPGVEDAAPHRPLNPGEASVGLTWSNWCDARTAPSYVSVGPIKGVQRTRDG